MWYGSYTWYENLKVSVTLLLVIILQNATDCIYYVCVRNEIKNKTQVEL